MVGSSADRQGVTSIRVEIRPAGVRHRARNNHVALRPDTGQPLPQTLQPPRTPTSTLGTVLMVGLISALLALVFGARGLLHAGEGMPDGPMRSATLAAARPLVAATEAAHLTLPWDAMQSALGRKDAPAGPSLLSNPVPVTAAAALHPDPAAVSRLPASAVLSHAHFSGPRAGHVRRRRPGYFVPTPRHPLRLLITGDSLTEFLGPDLVNDAAAAGPVRGFVDTHYGTGLVRPDYVDWSAVARQQMATYRPDAVVVMMGGNDFQNIQLPDGTILLASTPAWTREYQRRAEVCMRIWTSDGRHRLYWLSMPPVRSDIWTYNTSRIDLALRRAAAVVPGARYLDITGPVTANGRYADFVTVSGQPTLVREPDGIHFNQTGSAIVAGEVVAVLQHDWHLRK